MIDPSVSKPVDLLLVLAVDVSSSIDPEEAYLQRQGYLAALTDPEVLAHVRKGIHGAIGLAYAEWSGIEYQRLVLPWTRIASPSDAQAWADALKQAPLQSRRGTSIARGIDFARGILNVAPWSAARRIIDVSGDGVNNSTELVEEARDRAAAEGITINGIAIEGEEPRYGGVAPADRLEDYYRTTVIGGHDAFVVAAEDFRSFGAAIKRKLLREIA
ncbi:MAG TPA: DUF1194 domain-containing protein [Roseomonas sp.]|jgi:hypothetical protein